MENILDNVKVRKIRLEDAPELKRINSAIINSPSAIDFQQIIEEQKQKNEEETSLIAELEGQVIGYMISYIIYGGFGLEKSAWIATLGVDPKFMGQGIGKRLAKEIFRIYESKGVSYIYTSVIWDSIDLLSFFKTLGFDRSDFINLRRPLH